MCAPQLYLFSDMELRNAPQSASPNSTTGKRPRNAKPLEKEEKKEEVAALWQLALTSLLPALAEHKQKEFLDALLANPQFTRKVMKEGSKLSTHTTELANADMVELVCVAGAEEGTESVPEVSTLSIRVGQLPWQLVPALKDLFYNLVSPARIAAREQAVARNGSTTPAYGRVTPDGRAEFCIREECDDDRDHWHDAWMRHLDDLALEHQIGFDERGPNGDDETFIDVQADLGVNENTNLHCAYDLYLNNQTDQLEDWFHEHFTETFFGETGSDFDAFKTECATANGLGRSEGFFEPTPVPVNAVWVRKPRVRLVIQRMQ